MPSKAQIKKVLTDGTPRQRITLLANSAAHWVDPLEPAVITPEEHKALEDSFRTDFELRLYRKFQRLDEVSRTVLMQLSQLSLEHDLIVTKIRWFDHARNILIHFEDVLGGLTDLVSEECGEKTQISIWKRFLKENKGGFPVYSKPELDIEKGEDGVKRAYVRLRGGEIPTDAKDVLSAEDYELVKKQDSAFASSLLSYALLLKSLGGQLNNVRRSGKSWISAVRDIFDEHNFQVQPYKKFIDRLETQLRTEEISFVSELGQRSIDEQLEKARSSDPEYREIIERLAKHGEDQRRLFWLPYDEIEIDENMRQQIIQLYDRSEINSGPK